LDAEGITALGEDGGNINIGLYNEDGASAVLRGGSFTARGGTAAQGISNSDSNTTLFAEGVTALGQGDHTYSTGLYNADGSSAVLHDGSFTALGAGVTRGIHSRESATLEADGITALGEGGSYQNFGLWNFLNASVTLRGGSFTGRGGSESMGIENDAADLLAENAVILGEEGSSVKRGLHNKTSASTHVVLSVLEGSTNSVVHTGGSVIVSNSRLVGGAVSGVVTCTLVSRGTTVNTGATCP